MTVEYFLYIHGASVLVVVAEEKSVLTRHDSTILVDQRQPDGGMLSPVMYRLTGRDQSLQDELQQGGKHERFRGLAAGE